MKYVYVQVPYVLLPMDSSVQIQEHVNMHHRVILETITMSVTVGYKTVLRRLGYRALVPHVHMLKSVQIALEPSQI